MLIITLTRFISKVIWNLKWPPLQLISWMQWIISKVIWNLKWWPLKLICRLCSELLRCLLGQTSVWSVTIIILSQIIITLDNRHGLYSCKTAKLVRFHVRYGICIMRPCHAFKSYTSEPDCIYSLFTLELRAREVVGSGVPEHLYTSNDLTLCPKPMLWSWTWRWSVERRLTIR